MEWIPLAVAVLGSTGIIGAVTAAVQLSRRARLTRSISAAAKIADQVAPGSATRLVLQQAIEMDMLRLAAGSIIKIRPRDVALWAGLLVAVPLSLAITYVGATLGLIAKEAPWADWVPIARDPAFKAWSGWAMMMAFVMSVGGSLGMNMGVYKAREEFVAAAMLEQRPPVVFGRLRRLARSWNEHHGVAIQSPQRSGSGSAENRQGDSPS